MYLGNDPFHILRKILDKKDFSVSVNKQQSSLASNQQTIIRSLNNSSNSGAQCPHCRRIYANPAAVTRHIKKYCLKEKRFGCIFCSYRSKRKDHIVRHTKRVHNTQLQEKIDEGMINNPTDAVLQDFKEEIEASGNITVENENEDEMEIMDFSALYPDISEAPPSDVEEGSYSHDNVKTEMLTSDNEDYLK